MDNNNLRNQAAIKRANESQEQSNERCRANSLRQRLARQRVNDTFRTREQSLLVYRASLLHFAFEYDSNNELSH